MIENKVYDDVVKQLAHLRKENEKLKTQIKNYDKIIETINKAIWRIR